MANILIAFFSRADENYLGGVIKHIDAGNTEIIANKILKYVKADLFKIEMKIPYAKDYNTCFRR